MRDLRDSKSGLRLLELLKIPVTWSHFIISIFFLFFHCLSLFRETPRFCSQCYRPQDSNGSRWVKSRTKNAREKGGERTFFAPQFSFPDRVRLILALFPSLIAEVLVSIRSGSTLFTEFSSFLCCYFTDPLRIKRFSLLVWLSLTEEQYQRDCQFRK